METENLALIISALVAVAAVGMTIYTVWTNRQPITVNTLTETLKESTTTAKELAEVALTGAQAAEQLYRSGKITKDERFRNAFDYVNHWFGDAYDMETVTAAIEAGVLIVNATVGGLGKKEILH